MAEGFEVAVVGAGPAGVTAAAREQGASVALVERGNLGGTCTTAASRPSCSPTRRGSALKSSPRSIRGTPRRKGHRWRLTWLEGCEAAGIPAQELTTSEALRRELLVHPKIGRAFRVPDASCDSFALCDALRESAESEGATLLTYHRVDDFRVEVKAYLPGIRRGSIVRSWDGVRPLYDPATQSSSAEGPHVDNRKATRTFDVLDHATRDGVGGIGSIIGRKLTTFRLMAERTADAVCKELGVDRPCATATTELAPARAGFGGWGGEDRAEPGIWDA